MTEPTGSDITSGTCLQCWAPTTFNPTSCSVTGGSGSERCLCAAHEG